MLSDQSSLKPTLIVFADDWGRHPSSCQHLIKRLIGDYNVLWVNSIGTRRLRLDKFTLRRVIEKLRNWKKGVLPADQTMWVYDLPMLPYSENRAVRAMNRLLITSRLRRALRRLNLTDPIVITTLPYIADLIGDLPRRGLTYYCTDDYSYWPDADRPAMQRAEHSTLSKADLVLAVSEVLAKRFATHPNCRYFPHGVDINHFATVQRTEAAAELAALPSPRIGFFGLIYEKLDFDLLATVAKTYSTCSLVLVGPTAYCPDWFRELPNVHFAGPQNYSELPKWIAGLDVLLLPYVNDEMIRQSNPLKLRECLATGKPTVSINIPEVRQYEPWVRVGEAPEQFISQIAEALSETKKSSAIEARQNMVRNDDWDARAIQLTSWLTELTSQSSLSRKG